MSAPVRPVSLVAERAVRYLKSSPGPVSSVVVAREVLSTYAADETQARRILDTAFGGDPRLLYGPAGWSVVEAVAGTASRERARTEVVDRVLVALEGEREGKGRPFTLRRVSMIRLRGEDVLVAWGADIVRDASNEQVPPALREALERETVVVHDPPGALRAFEHWIGDVPLAAVSLRKLGQDRLGLPAQHSVEALAARLGLSWRDSEDPLEQAEVLDACLRGLRRPDESIDDLRVASARGGNPVDWSRFGFDRGFVNAIPHVPGTYRFLDAGGQLIYVGKSSNLNRRIGSYLRDGVKRSPRVQALLDRLHAIEYRATGSDLEALLREAEQIRRQKPEANVQRRLHAQAGRASRLRSILILEPAAPPNVLRAYLIHAGRLIARIGIGRRGGGLERIERVLDDYFFLAPTGPTPAAGPDLDVELIVRWLAANRDRAVAFDPTDLRSSREVVDRLRWFLDQGSPLDPDGAPIFTR